MPALRLPDEVGEEHLTRRRDWIRLELRFPTQTVLHCEVRRDAPAVLNERRGLSLRDALRARLFNADVPNAGLLFVEFMTSKEGQQIFQKANYLPARSDVAPLTPELIPERGGFTATVLTPAITDKAIDRWDDIFKQLFR